MTDSNKEIIIQELTKTITTISDITRDVNLIDKIHKVATLCVKALQNGNKIMFCGNGGSASDAQHIAAELIGRYKLNRPAFSAIALNTDTSVLTALANDFGYETIFARQVEGLGKVGDILVGLSTSGNSKSIIHAIEKAKELNIITIAFTGRAGGLIQNMVDVSINAPSNETAKIQECHIIVGHIICQVIENTLIKE